MGELLITLAHNFISNNGICKYFYDDILNSLSDYVLQELIL